jgi:DNA end-binding protein Ku
MARAIWSGSISFGLVNVPVKVYTAVRQKDIHFTQLDEKGDRIRYKRVSEKTGREVDYDDIKKGYEVEKGSYVMVEPDELEAARPEATRTIEITDFVDLDEIDPIYFDHTYYLAPAGKDRGAAKAYALLLEAMQKQGKVAIGTVVMRTKQYLAAIRPRGGVLVMSTMLFPDEVVAPDEVPDVPDRMPEVSDREVKMASQVIEALTTEWDPERYHDDYRREVLELIRKKAKGKEIVVPKDKPKEAQVVDLMAALEASLEAAKGRKAPAKRRKAPATRRKAPAKSRKPVAKKAARKSA